MNVHALDWDKKNESHIAEHGISIFEIEEAILFSKPFYQRTREGKYIAYAVTEDGRYLFIVFVLKDSTRISPFLIRNRKDYPFWIRVISARDMAEKEKRYYKKRKGIK